ncbi:MAG TPA: HEAT repeat domain-containing protein [Terriglobia bacterium]
MGEKPQSNAEAKAEALEFGHNLQRAFRIAALYSVDHSATDVPVQQAYDSLNFLLKQSKEFTFGFLNQRVLLNNILTSDSSLAPMEVEFTKRGFKGVTFSAGITFPQFKRALSLLITKASVIKQNGGIAAFLKRNPVEGMKVLAAEEQKKGPAEDMILEADGQAFLEQQDSSALPGGVNLPGLTALLRLAGAYRPTTTPATPTDTLQVVWKATEAALIHPDSSRHETIKALANVLNELTPSYLLSALPSNRQAALYGLSIQEIASELTEDIFLQWAANVLATAPQGATGMEERREVARVLSRAVKTPEAAESLLAKLARLLESAEMPKEVHDQIRQELKWNLSTRGERYAHLIRLTLFSEADFFHLTSFIEESESEGEIANAEELALHYCRQYFSSLKLAPALIRVEWLARVPELLHKAASLHSVGFIREMATGLCPELFEPTLHPEYHSKVADYLAGIAQSSAGLQDFETALKVALELERSLRRDHIQHEGCCEKALGNLLTAQSIESLIGLCLQKSDDPTVFKANLALLRLAAAQVSEVALDLLEKEADVTKRLRVLRLAGHLGPRAIKAVRKMLLDERWYMVRNACSVLAALQDPELCEQLQPALRHPDPRVQRAALAAIVTAHPPDLGKTLVKALPDLPAYLQETALDELLLLKDPAAVQGIAEFAFGGKEARAGLLLKSIQVLAAIPSDEAVALLGKLLADPAQQTAVRKAALLKLTGSSSAKAQEALADFVRFNPRDPLAEECRKAGVHPFASAPVATDQTS